MKAENLTQAFNNFNVDTALLFAPGADAMSSQSSSFYIDREGNPFTELKYLLLKSPAHDKILFTGQLGSGKSTELNRLAEDQEIKDKFFLVKYSVRDKLDIFNVKSIDLLISLLAITFNEALDEGLPLGDSLKERLNGWWKTIKTVPGEQTEKEDRPLKDFFTDLLAGLRMSPTIRKIVRENVEPRLIELIEIINLTIQTINASLPAGKQILIIIDDLEKIPDIKKAKLIYHDTGLYLAQPQCKIVYTVPIALHYSADFKQVINTFGKSYILPNIRLTKVGDSEYRDPAGYKLMREFVYKRMNRDLIEEKALVEAIKYSGGVVREITRIIQGACMNAELRGLKQITLEAVKSSAVTIRNEYDRMLGEKHREILAKVKETNKLPGGDDLSVDLLHSLSVLEYENGARWCDVNPIIRPLLDRHK